MLHTSRVAPWLLAGVLTVSTTVVAADGPTWPEERPPEPPSEDDERLTEAIFQALAGEVASQKGQPEAAARYLLEAARLAGDARLARRAARLALTEVDDVELAREATELWLQLEPESRTGRQIQGALALRAGDVQAAEQAFVSVLDEANGSAQVFVDLAQRIAAEADATTGLALFERLVARYPDEPAARLAQARLAIQFERLEPALEALDRALALRPDYTEARVLSAQVLVDLERGDEAVARLEQAVSANPLNRALRESFARLLYQLDRLDSAVDQFQALHEGEPSDNDLLQTLARVALQADRLELAKKHLETLESRGVRVNEARYFLGRIAEIQGRHADALDYFDRVGGRQYAFDARLRRGVVRTDMGDFEAARQVFEGLLADVDDPDNQVRVYFGYGALLRETEQFQEAFDLYAEGLEELPGHPDLLYAQGLIAERLDRIDRLEENMRRILADEPDDASALNALGYTLADRTTRFEEAYDYIHRAYALEPDDPAIIDSMGWIYFRLQDYPKALRYLREAYEIEPDPEIGSHLVEALWASGQTDEARSLWRGLAAESPQSRFVSDVHARLFPELDWPGAGTDEAVDVPERPAEAQPESDGGARSEGQTGPEAEGSPEPEGAASDAAGAGPAGRGSR